MSTANSKANTTDQECSLKLANNTARVKNVMTQTDFFINQQNTIIITILRVHCVFDELYMCTRYKQSNMKSALVQELKEVPKSSSFHLIFRDQIAAHMRFEDKNVERSN